jgi:hypothetical protein
MASTQNSTLSARTFSKLFNNEPRLFARIADHYLEAGDPKKSAKLLVKGLAQFPNSVSGWVVKGKLHNKLRQPKLARAAFEKALQLDSEIPFAHRQCAELALDEGDQEGYIQHLRHLVRLEMLDDNIQVMLQTAIMRDIAVKRGLYTKETVTRVVPTALRLSLLRNDALPAEFARRIEREDLDSGSSENPSPTKFDRPAVGPPPNRREPLAWEDPKVVEATREPESSKTGRYMRVSWADAVNERPAQQLVEIGPEQFEPSAEEDSIELDDFEAAENTLASDNSDASDPSPRPAYGLPSSMHSIEMSSASKESGDKAEDDSELMSRHETPAGQTVREMARPKIEHGYKFKAPDDELIEPPMNTQVGEARLQPSRPDQTPEGLSRPRLTPNIKLPEPRSLDLDDTEKAVPIRKLTFPTQPTVQPNLSPAEPQAIPRIMMDSRVQRPEDTGRIPRDATPIFRLLSADKDKIVKPLRPSISELLTGSDVSSVTESSMPESVPETSQMLRPVDQDKTRPISESSPLNDLSEAVVPEKKPFKIIEGLESSSGGRFPDENREETAKSSAVNVANSALTDDMTKALVKPELKVEVSAVSEALTGVSLSEEEPKPAAEVKSAVTPPGLADKLAKLKEQRQLQTAEKVEAKTTQTESTPEARKAALPNEAGSREAEARHKLASIVKEVTGKPPVAIVKSSAKPATQAPAEVQGDSKVKSKIATKTLAELYASQGDWLRAVEVYEILLEKFPTNETYRARLESLRAKIGESK